MSDWDHCPHCRAYVDMPKHRETYRVYEARFDEDDDWEETCGETFQYTEDSDGHALRSAAEAFVTKVDKSDCHRISTETRRVWVRAAGEEGNGRPVKVETEMVPEYHTELMTPCSTGCGGWGTSGLECAKCRQARWQREWADRAAAKVTPC
jgi:hypothetical protein